MHRARFLSFSFSVLSALLLISSARAENVLPVLITQNVDESKLVALGGNTRREANAKNDRGRVADDLVIDHLQLLLKRSPAQEQELEKLIDDLHDSSSPNFHHWLTSQQFGERFGLATQDRETIKNWLRSHGMKVNVEYTNGIVIDFSGTAGQLRDAFHTEIHNLEVKGVRHIANTSDPKIPAALAPAIQGIVALHNFGPHSTLTPRPQYTVAVGGTKNYLVVPGDLETIYNLNPLFSSGITGQGQTIALIEDTDVYTVDDWTYFRSLFGLSSYSDASLTQIHPAPPSGNNNCTDPGANGNDREAIVDVEYASAVAPSATLLLASCQNTGTFGGLIAVENLLNQSGPPPAIMSISYGECESQNGSASNAAFNSTYQQAVAEGVSVFVASGDHAGAFCDYYDDQAQYGIGVNGWGSSPYVVSVGGTDFGDTYAKTNSTYWKASNSSTYESAKSYVPEIPWNNSCASSLIADYHGFSQTYGTGGFCNSALGEEDFLTTWGGGGGPSGCATGTPAVPGVVGGTCSGWPKPSYQSLLGNPSDGVRDLPDVALFAANGVWLHYYPYCFSGPGGIPCTEAPVNWPGAGGTSFASPIMAAIQALVNQQAGAPQGNPNFVYYSLASAQYGTTGDKTCDSTLGKATNSGCIFYDITQGDNVVDCVSTAGLGASNCYLPSGDNGVLSTSPSAYQPAFAATTGWDFATGIGSVNAYNLVFNWPAVFTLAASPASLTVLQGSSTTTDISIAPSSGFSGAVTFSASGLPNGVTASFSPNGTTSATTLTLTASATAAAGTVLVNVTGTSGTLTRTITVSLTVSPSAKNFSLSSNPTSLTVVQGSSGSSTITVAPINGFTGKVTFSASGLPSGVTASFSPTASASSSTLTLTASATAATGTATVTITGTSGSLTQATTIALTVNPEPTFSLSASPSSVAVVQGTTATSTITITPANGFTGNVTFSASGLPSGVTAAFSSNPATSSTILTFTASASAKTGAATVTVTGTSGSLTETTTIALTVSASPTFVLSASPSSLTIVQGTTGTSAITITPSNSFSGSVTLSASGLPSGVTASFVPNPATTSSTLTFTAGSTAAKGTSTVTVTGTSGSLTQTTTISLTVSASPTYTISASPSTLSVVQGTSGTSTITITPSSGFSGSVTLSASGLPTGVTATFSPNPASTTSTLTLAASATASLGTATVTITGTSGSITQTTTISLTVTASPSFTISASPGTLSLAQGTSGSSTITLAPANGFSGSVTFSASGLPSGVTASFSPNPASSISTLTLTASASAAAGTATVTITGTSGSLTQTTTISLTVVLAQSFKLSASPTTLSVARGATGGKSTITITPVNGFSGSVTLAASGLPTGVTASFSVNPATTKSVVTLTASKTAASGTYTVTITGTSGTLSATTTITLTIPVGTFSLTASPSAVTVAPQSAETTTITVVPTQGFNQSVTLSADGMPPNTKAIFAPTSTTKTSTLTLSVSGAATAGQYSITVTGTSGSLKSSTTVTLTIQ